MVITDKKRTLIFVNVLITCIASSMLSTALTTALPAINADLNIDVIMAYKRLFTCNGNYDAADSIPDNTL